jgi:hypothetical protein
LKTRPDKCDGGWRGGSVLGGKSLEDTVNRSSIKEGAVRPTALFGPFGTTVVTEVNGPGLSQLSDGLGNSVVPTR